MWPAAHRWSVPSHPADTVLAREGENDDLGHDEGEGPGPLPGGLRSGGRGQAWVARVEGLLGLPGPDRGGLRVGGLRLGRGGLDGLRHGPRDPRDHAGGRSPRSALARSVPRELLRLGCLPILAGAAMGRGDPPLQRCARIGPCPPPTPPTPAWSWWAAA